MLTAEDSDVRIWADELIDDEFTGKHFSLCQNNHYVYGILTGFNYDDSNDEHCRKIFSHVCSYLPLELIERINSISDSNQDQTYEKILIETFQIIEQSIREHMNEILSEKTALELSLVGNDLSNYPKIKDQLHEYCQRLSFGFSCVVTVINTEKIYVANIGDTRAILCVRDDKFIRPEELSTRHDLSNQNEMKRLESISIETEVLRMNQKIGNMTLTRCLGNLRVKDDYRSYSDLLTATSDPILSQPSLNSTCINDSCLFMILASASLFQALQENLSEENVLKDLLSMIQNKLSETNDLKSVPDKVIQDIFEIYRQKNEKYPLLQQQEPHHYSKPILLIRTFSKNNKKQFIPLESDDKHKTVKVDPNNKTVTPIIIMNDDTNETKSSNDSNGSGKNVEDEISAYVDFIPLLKALEIEQIDYDSF